MSKSGVNKSVQEAYEKKQQYENFLATGKYRWRQIGIDKETDSIIFYPDDESKNEIYDVSFFEVDTHEKQIRVINRLIEKHFFSKKVLEEFFIALAILGYMPE